MHDEHHAFAQSLIKKLIPQRFPAISAAVTFFPLSILTFAAPPSMDTLEIHQTETGSARGCTPDKVCVEIAPSQVDCEGDACATDLIGGTNLSLMPSGDQGDPAYTLYRLTSLSSAEEYSALQLWPKLIRFQDGILAGVETQVNTMYSGGGGSSTTLHLIAFLHGQKPFEVLSVPQSTNVMIRACFSERDMRQRAGVCHDEYRFEASLALTGASAAGMPVLRYRSTATSFPGAVSRSKDSLAGRPLRKRDIVTITNPQCSYQRLYRFSPETHNYAPDVPPPDCSDYTNP